MEEHLVADNSSGLKVLPQDAEELAERGWNKKSAEEQNNIRPGSDISSTQSENRKEDSQSTKTSAAAIDTVVSLSEDPRVQEDGFIVVQLSEDSRNNQYSSDGNQSHQ